jgi:hypothetical protein
LVLMALLIGAATIGAWMNLAPQLVCGLLAGAGVIVLAQLSRRWLKVSLHSAFALLGAVMLWPDRVAVLAMLVFAAAVIWSRLVLRRHTRAEVVVGAIVGAAAGAAYHGFV